MGSQAKLRDSGEAGNEGAPWISFSFYFEKGALDYKSAGMGGGGLLAYRVWEQRRGQVES